MRKLFQLLSVVTLLSLLTACGSSSTSSSNTASQGSGSSGGVSLVWAAPSTRIDGSYLPIGELAGYRIYMGTSANDLSPVVDLNDENMTRYTVRNLTSGSYYFAVSAYDSNGVESALSQVVLKTVG